MILNIIDVIGSSYFTAKKVYSIIGILTSILVIHKGFYYAIGFLWTRKFKKAKNNHKYGILIAARNEKNVIGNLLDSIKKQDYPSDNLTVFVVADNCTDNTAQIARDKGAVVYERFDDVHKTKGYALEFLLDNIERDYGRLSFEGYFVFDADNLLKENYISKMNDAFDSGEKIITSYRNTKNFDENWISSTYALHWLRSIRMNHRARSVLHLATNIQGTGFLFASEIVKNGWHYTSLTEDRALTADAVAQGYQITYQDEAEFFDEQPTSLKVALRQRLRWSKGHLLAFVETGPSLFLNIFFGKTFVKKNWTNNEEKDDSHKNVKQILKDILESLRHRFASFDTLAQLTPIVIINFFKWLVVSVFIYSCYSYSNGISNLNMFGGNTWIAKLLSFLFPITLNVKPGFSALIVSAFVAIWLRILYRVGMYFGNCIIAIYLFIMERKRIVKFSVWKKCLFVLTWPTFDIIDRYTKYVALFVKVSWKPIPHDSKVTIDDVSSRKAA